MAKVTKKKPAAKKAGVKKGTKKAKVPLPETVPKTTRAAAKAKVPKPLRKADRRLLKPLAPAMAGADASILDRLWQVVEERRQSGDTMHSHSARLLARGTAKVAQKLGEEAVECVIEAATGNRAATVLESADLLYHLLVVWVDAGIRPEEVWAELVRRQGISGIAEKAARPRGIIRAAGTTKLP
jgi:phosphoribosyl-ATP pyrophosphohydrolase